MSSTEGGAAGAAPAHDLSRSPIGRLLSRSTLVSAAFVLIAAALAWRWLLLSGMSAMPMDGHGVAAMRIAPWSSDYLFAAFTMWGVMMVAMMLPSAAPMILLHTRIDRAPTAARRAANSLAFMLAYLLVWTAFSMIAAVAQSLLIHLGLLSAASLAVGGRALAAALLVLAAVYQLSPAKAACLDQCRSPIHFVMRYWRPGLRGALRLGLVHGLYCVGCCWGLMLLLFVTGVMNLAWVALLAALVLVEKLAPPRLHASRLIAALLLAAAALLIAGRG